MSKPSIGIVPDKLEWNGEPGCRGAGPRGGVADLCALCRCFLFLTPLFYLAHAHAVKIDQRLSQKLTLTNKSDKDACYKIKTTHVDRYAVLPGAAVIAAGDSAEVEIVLIKKDSLPDPDSLEDRFLIQAAFQTDPGVKVADFWAKGKGAPLPVLRATRRPPPLPFAALFLNCRFNFCSAEQGQAVREEVLEFALPAE